MKPAGHHGKSRRTSVADKDESGGRSRRITNINPNFKMTELTEVRLDSRQKPLKAPQNAYAFHCGGDLSSGKHVEWNATFDKPLEQLIYPSLQRFDMKAYEEKKKNHYRMHGYDSLEAGKVPNIQLDPVKITKVDPLDDQKMFLHTPTWTVKITAATPQFTTTVRTRTATEDSTRLRDRTVTEDSIRTKTLSRTTSTEEADTADVIEEIVTTYASLASEIEIEGEKYLRQKMKEKYQQSLRNEEIERELLQDEGTPTAGAANAERRRLRKRGTLIKPVDLENADLLVSFLCLVKTNHLIVCITVCIHLEGCEFAVDCEES